MKFTGDEPLAEFDAIIDVLVLVKRTAKGPDGGKDKVQFIPVLIAALGSILRRQQAFENVAERNDHAKVLDLGALESTGAECFQARIDVAVKEHGQARLFRRVFALVEPRLHVRPPAQIAWIQIQNTGARDCGGCSVLQIANFEKQAHVRLERNTFVTRQRQNLVVVHDRVQT